MPELPEVESLRLLLSPSLEGQKFVKIEQKRKKLRFPFPKEFQKLLIESTIVQITRRAKYLLFHLSIGQSLVVHLGMTGRLLLGSLQDEEKIPNSRNVVGQYHRKEGRDSKHDHVIFYIKNGLKVTYNDARRFGFMVLIETQSLHKHPLMKNLGVEPLSEDFCDSCIVQRAKGRRTNLKTFLLDQRNIAGLGNIYACEALFRAGLSPTRRTGTIVSRKNQLKSNARGLVPSVREVIKEAIAAGGSTLKDFLKPDGSIGNYQNNHRVYDREGEPCLRSECQGVVRRIFQGGRSTFYCPHCQK